MKNKGKKNLFSTPRGIFRALTCIKLHRLRAAKRYIRRHKSEIFSINRRLDPEQLNRDYARIVARIRRIKMRLNTAAPSVFS